MPHTHFASQNYAPLTSKIHRTVLALLTLFLMNELMPIITSNLYNRLTPKPYTLDDQNKGQNYLNFPINV